MRFLLMSLVLSLAVAQSVGAEPPTGWSQLVKKIGEKGHRIDIGFYLQNGQTFDRSQDREVEYISIAFGVTPDGQAALLTSTNREKWSKQNDGTWRREHHIRILNDKGEIQQLVHKILIVDYERGSLLSEEKLAVPPIDDVSVVEDWQEEVYRWLELEEERVSSTSYRR